MKWLVLLFRLVCFGWLAGIGWAAGVQVRLSPEVIYAGDAFTLEVSAEGEEVREAHFRFSGEVQSAGRSQSVMIVNGARSSKLSYTLIPAREGEYRLESLEAELASGKRVRYAGQAAVKVKRLEADRAVSVSARAVMPEEVDAAVEAPLLPGDEVAVEVTVRAPALELEGQKRSPFWGADLFGRLSERLPQVAFRADVGEEGPLRLKEGRATLKGPEEVEGALQWTWRFAYVAVRTGKQTFAAPLLNDRRVTGVDARGQAQFTRSAAIGETLTIEVAQPPLEGRPTGWTGAICRRFAVAVDTDAQNVKMGDPVAVRVTLEADCDGALLRAPELGELEGFRRYGEVTRERLEGGARFIYHFRPIQAGLLEVPPMRFGWFDRAARVYREETSSAVPLRVRPSAQLLLSDDDAQAAGLLPPPALLLPDPGQAPAQPPRRWPEGWALGALALGVGALVLRLVARPMGQLIAALGRALTAGQPRARALRALRRAKSAEEALGAIRAWAGEQALTERDFRRLLPEDAAGAEAVVAYAQLERSRYTGQGDWQGARACLVKVLASLKGAVRVVVLMGVLAGWGAQARAEGAQADSFLREQAEALSIAATTAEAYAQAAAIWQQLLEAGDESRAVLQNGTACLLLAHQPQVALTWARRQVWLHGWDDGVAQGVAAAYAQLGEAPSVWVRTWRCWPGVGRAIDWGCAGLGALLLLGVLCSLRPGRRARVVAFVAVGLCAGLAQAKVTSAAWSLNPASPVYVGQAYELCLTLETAADEEISTLRVDQGPQSVPEQRVSQADGKRRTTFVWELQSASPRLESIPQARLLVQLTRVQRFGFGSHATTTIDRASVPAFQYEVMALPPEATGAAIGHYTLSLAANRGTFAPGDIREVTAILQAEAGIIPADFAFAWRAPESFPGRLYPFREVERTRKRLVAKAWVAPEPEAEAPSVALEPLAIFDVQTRKRSEVQAPALTLRAQEAEREASEAVEAAPEPALLRFAPSATALILGPVEAPWQELNRREGWAMVRTATGRCGWVPLKDLLETKGE
ncbi:MAG: BatD family protein [Candidatus Spyradenecus sp.]